MVTTTTAAYAKEQQAIPDQVKAFFTRADGNSTANPLSAVSIQLRCMLPTNCHHICNYQFSSSHLWGFPQESQSLVYLLCSIWPGTLYVLCPCYQGCSVKSNLISGRSYPADSCETSQNVCLT